MNEIWNEKDYTELAKTIIKRQPWAGLFFNGLVRCEIRGEFYPLRGKEEYRIVLRKGQAQSQIFISEENLYQYDKYGNVKILDKFIWNQLAQCASELSILIMTQELSEPMDSSYYTEAVNRKSPFALGYFDNKQVTTSSNAIDDQEPFDKDLKIKITTRSVEPKIDDSQLSRQQANADTWKVRYYNLKGVPQGFDFDKWKEDFILGPDSKCSDFVKKDKPTKLKRALRI